MGVTKLYVQKITFGKTPSWYYILLRIRGINSGKFLEKVTLPSFAFFSISWCPLKLRDFFSRISNVFDGQLHKLVFEVLVKIWENSWRLDHSSWTKPPIFIFQWFMFTAQVGSALVATKRVRTCEKECLRIRRYMNWKKLNFSGWYCLKRGVDSDREETREGVGTGCKKFTFVE